MLFSGCGQRPSAVALAGDRFGQAEQVQSAPPMPASPTPTIGPAA